MCGREYGKESNMVSDEKQKEEEKWGEQDQKKNIYTGKIKWWEQRERLIRKQSYKTKEWKLERKVALSSFSITVKLVTMYGV